MVCVLHHLYSSLMEDNAEYVRKYDLKCHGKMYFFFIFTIYSLLHSLKF
jgi:hypothetical protein